MAYDPKQERFLHSLPAPGGIKPAVPAMPLKAPIPVARPVAPIVPGKPIAAPKQRWGQLMKYLSPKAAPMVPAVPKEEKLPE